MTNPAAIGRDKLLDAASDPSTTPFDYIVVGSGAGGGPLAARLALEGRRVLVIEAGVDPGTGQKLTDSSAAPMDPGPHGVREVYAVPAFNGAATEKRDISWEFSVRHFADRNRQKKDLKYFKKKDPSVTGQGSGQGGILYPRCAALGGCTAHYALIMVRPNDSDWDRIAESTGDSTWRSGNMQGYFAKLEDCLYYKVFRGFSGRLRGGFAWFLELFNPRGQLEPGGHGFAGWQKTSFIDPLLIFGIVKTDWTFLRVLLGVLRAALRDKAERGRLWRALRRFEIVQVLDPNVRSPDFPTRVSRLSLIPVGTDGKCRRGLREHLLEVAVKHPDRLVLATGMHATRVLFDKDAEGVPRAVGVEVAEGTHLYGASPLSDYAKRGGFSKAPPNAQYFARGGGEVILAGGSFNTPQILMLSGIGDASHLNKLGIAGPRNTAGKAVAPIVNLPGVGENLQDRYEVSVVSEMKRDFSVLRGASFRPGDRDDPILRQWERDKTGLYTTNGGAVAMMLHSAGSAAAHGEPDLFLFGLPAAFRGYYWNYSRQLLRRKIRAPKDQTNLWTWLILKAYTHNNHGTVRLLSDDPFVPPEILFNSFQSGEGNEQDIDALCDGVRRARELNRYIGVVATEVQPGPELPDGSEKLAQWLQSQAWGHHACGTCRIGSDPWRRDVSELEDVKAVLDSKFRVHGVRNLRVVDASVFPHIPGYFLVSSVFMIGEKAADVLLADSTAYPAALEAEEAAALRARRAVAGKSTDGVSASRLPQDTVGLALSGGGIRSATFCLGVLQALAACRRLGDIDFMSTVSGGGFIGGFLGRLFTRLEDDVRDKVGRIEAILANANSPEIWWLRKNADYIASAGLADVETNIAIVARNLGAVHFFIGALLFGVFGGLRWLADLCSGRLRLPVWRVWDIEVSVWWWVPLAVLFFAVVPLAVGYWLTPSAGRRYAPGPLLLWVALLGSAVYGLGVPGAAPWSGLAIVALLLAWLVQEVTRWRVGYKDGETAADAAADGAPDSVPNVLVRSRMARTLGVVLLGLLVSILWVVLDSVARYAASPLTTWAMLGTAPIILVLRLAALAWLKGGSTGVAAQWYEWGRKAIVAGVAFLLAAVLVLFLDVLAHLAFDASRLLGAWTVLTAFAGSFIVGRWFRFLNLSSLQQAYGQKLVRTFLGASNDARVHPSGADDPKAVEIPHADDDMFFDEYHPERNGGPLHLLNMTVNDTVAGSSGRQLRDDKGLPMCVGPEGVSVGRKYHALWQRRSGGLFAEDSILNPLPVAPDPNAFHVLARADDRPPTVERLRLGQWMGISGAAVATGTGRFTSVPQALLLGILNIRLGYWWDSGIRAGKRPGRYPPNFWRWLKSSPAWIFRMQATLLNEWRGYFPGPAERLWFLTDGGHFENTGLYELFRRRPAFMIAVDAGEDQQYQFDDLAVFTRQVRLDFNAEISWLDPSEMRNKGSSGWDAFDRTLYPVRVPEQIRSFVEPGAVGALTDLKRDSAKCSALARITYRDDPQRESWLLLIKPNLALPVSPDVRNYAAQHETFPNEPTAEQFFRDDQWESYRALGQRAGAMVFRPGSARVGGDTVPILAPIEVRKLSWWDTLRVQCFVSIPTFLLGLVAAKRWALWLFARLGAGRPTMRFLRELRDRYASEHLRLWFPVGKTLLVLAPETMEEVLQSDANAADPFLKKRALSRFVPDGVIISSGGTWRERRRFNEGALDFRRRLHRHHDAFLQIVRDETGKIPARVLRWPDFQNLGERLSQQVILGAGEVKPILGEQLTNLVACSNFLFRDSVNYPAFYGHIGDSLEGKGPGHCLVADAAGALQRGRAADSTRVPAQVGFWLFVLRDALELHVPRTLALIAAHRKVQQQVRAELAAAGPLTADAIDGLRYLEACVHEQLRLWTPVPLLMRRATRSFILQDEVAIEAEQQILMHAGFYHRDPQVFGEVADRFAPDRAMRAGFPAIYFFSAHRQSCIGRPLVTFLLKATLASLLSRYTFHLLGPDIDPESIPYLYDHFSVRLKAQ
ncbi:MAG TPA: cytochrome P450 [Casimicrobiaceae bacterium]